MSKKKSYMDRTNILSEGLLKMLGKLIPFKKQLKKAFSPKDKDALKDPGVMKAIFKFEKSLAAAHKHADEVDQKIANEKAGKGYRL